MPWDENRQVTQVVYYDTGVGALGEYPGFANRVLGSVDKHFGGTLGAGFEANIEQAVTFLVNNYISGDDLFIFGFSRGAAQARAVTHFIDWMGGLPEQRDAYYLPRFFREYLRMKGSDSPRESPNNSIRNFKGNLRQIDVTLLGVFDTVMSLSPRFEAKGQTTSGSRSFHVKDRPAACVRHARQALAIDERRFDFKPEIWVGCSNDQTLHQRWFCGVHANIGGGYIHDGLANLPYQWMVDEAEAYGLKIDREFSGKYRAFAQDKLYDSRTKIYRIAEFLRRASGKGARRLTDLPVSANLRLDKSVITRLHANSYENSSEFKRMTHYRPENLFSLLRKNRANLTEFIGQTGSKPRIPILPNEVLEKLGAE